MNKTIIFILLATLIVAYGCANVSQLRGNVVFDPAFNDAVERINEIHESHGSTLKSAPETTDQIDNLLAQLIGFNAINELPESIEILIDFRIKSLEADKLHAEGWQWGRGSTTKWGFGCRKGFARVSEAARLRNLSATTGFEAVNILQEFVDKYPEEAKNLNYTQKDVLFLNAVYFQIQESALRDRSIVRSGCKDYWNETS